MPFQHRNNDVTNLPTYPPGDPLREGLRAALRGRGVVSATVKFRTGRDGHRLRAYRLAPTNGALPGDLAEQLRTLAQAMIDSDLPGRNPDQDRQGRLAWTLETDRMEIWY